MPSRFSRPATLAALAVSVATVAACDHAANPLSTGPVTDVNYYSPSLGLAMAPKAYPCGPDGCQEFIFVDTYDTTRNGYAFFEGGYNTGGADEISWPQDSAYDPGAGLEHVTYGHLSAGAHRFRFSDNTQTVVLDTTLTLAEGRKTILYVNDSLLAYRLVALDETGTGPEASATGPRIRVINFSPDVGPLELYVVGDSGQAISPASLPEQVPFDSVTPYVTLDPSLAQADGNIYMNFFAGADTSTTLASVKVPAEAGRSYHVVFFGSAFGGFLRYPPHGSGSSPFVSFSFNAQAWVREIF